MEQRKNKDRKWIGCILLLLCPFCVERVVSIPCVCPRCLLPKNSVNMITHWFLALAHRIEKHELELGADWQGEISSRMLFAGAVDLFVCNGVAPRLSLSSANSGRHLDFPSRAEHYRIQDIKEKMQRERESEKAYCWCSHPTMGTMLVKVQYVNIDPWHCRYKCHALSITSVLGGSV